MGSVFWSLSRKFRTTGLLACAPADARVSCRRAKQSTIAALRAFLEKAGVVFIAENGGGPGVRLQKGQGSQ
jgi:hypothetical protein